MARQLISLLHSASLKQNMQTDFFSVEEKYQGSKIQGSLKVLKTIFKYEYFACVSPLLHVLFYTYLKPNYICVTLWIKHIFKIHKVFFNSY